MNSRFTFAAVLVSLLTSNSWADTFLPTSGTQSWNVNANWDTNVYPNLAGASATLPVPTGNLTVNLGEPITIGSLTVGKSTAGNFNVTVGEGTQTLTFNGGSPSISNGFSSAATGQTFISAPLSLSSTLAVSQTDSATLQFTQPMSGTGGLTISRLGIGTNGSGGVVLGAANTYQGATTFASGSTNTNFLLVRLNDANSIPGGIGATGGTSNLKLTRSVVIGLGATDFTRGLGTGPAQIQFTTQGQSGWAAFGQDRAVKVCCNTVGADPFRLIWDSTGANFGTLVLGHDTADKTIDLQNTLDLQTSAASVSRTIRVQDGSAAIDGKISGPIINLQGTANLAFQGAGTLSLTAANTYNGTTTIDTPVVRLENAAALPSGNLSMTGNAILGLGVGNDLFNRALGTLANQMQFTGGGGFAAFGANRAVNLGGAGATVTWASGNFLPNATSLTLSADTADATVDFQNEIDLNGAERTVLAAGGSAVIDGKISGVISGASSASSLKKNNPGTLELSNVNTYAGTTTVNAGVLLLTNQFSIPGGIAGLNTNTIVFTGTNENNIGVIGLGQGDFTSTLSTSAGAGLVNLGTNAAFAGYTADRVVNFKLGGVTQQATWGLGGFVTGVLGMSAVDANAAVDVQNPIDLNGGSRKVKVLNGTASIDGMLSGAISGTGSLTKDGGGTLSLTGANTYDGGTTVTQGRLAVNNTTGSGVGTGNVIVNVGTLGGSGFIGTLGDTSNVTVNTGGRIGPGNSAGALTVFGDVSFATGTFFDAELGGLTAGTDFDKLAVNGAAALGGTLSVTLLNAFTPSGGNSFEILSATGGVSGTFSSVVVPTVPNIVWQVVYNANSVVLTAGLEGDYNDNGVVDAADYVLWRKGVQPLKNEVAAPLGTTDSADYDAWRARFGNPTPGSGSGLGGNQAVPEPATLVLLLLVAPLIVGRKFGRIR